MTEVSIKQRVAVPLDVAWATIIDIGRYPERVGSYVRVEFITSERTGVGARWRQWRTVFGREHDQTIEIMIWEPPRRLVTRAQESGAAYETTYSLDADGSETIVTMSFEVRPLNPVAGLLQRLLGRRLMASTQEAMERDLGDLAAAAVAGDHAWERGPTLEASSGHDLRTRQGRDPLDGKGHPPGEVSGVASDRIIDGKVVERGSFFDQSGMKQQMGATPGPEQG